jgi:hypothetical protein
VRTCRQGRRGDQVAIERDRACGVVIAGDDVIDTIGRAVGVDHGHNRDAQLVGLGHGQRFFLDVDDEQHVRHAAHLADTAQRRLQLGLVAFHARRSFLVRPSAPPSIASSIWVRRLIDLDTVCQLVSVPPSQRWFM